MVLAVVQRGYLPEGKGTDPQSLQHDVVSIAVTQVEATAGKGISIDRLARITGYSPFHFARNFKQHKGMTVHQFVDACRRRRVRTLLDEGYTKKAIGEELGFSCPPAFSRWYRSAFGENV